MAEAGRLVVLFGVVLVVVGAAMMVFGRVHLPGDITIRGGSFSVYIPIATSIILSIVLTVVLNLVLRQR